MAIMRLVDDWRKATRWYSTWITGFGAVASAFAFAASLAGGVVPWFAVAKPWECFAAAGFVFIAAFIGRLIHQKGQHDGDE